MRSSVLHGVSVALTTHNGAEFLPEQLESILAQTRLPDQVVMVDDASTDSTVRTAEALLGSAQFDVRVEVNTARLGVTANFERAIGLATGDLIILSDQDDVWLPRKIERIAAAFERDRGVGLIASNATVVDRTLKTLGTDTLSCFSHHGKFPRTSDEVFRHLVAYGNVFPGMVLAFARRFRTVLLDFPSFVGDDRACRWMHDGWIAVALSAVAPVRIVTDALALYRQHPAQYLGVSRKLDAPSASVPFVVRLDREIALRQELLHVLLERCGRDGVRRDALTYLEQSTDHLRFRRDLHAGQAPARRIATEIANGRYGRFSNGWKSAIRDASLRR